MAVHVDLVALWTWTWILGLDMCFENEIERKVSDFRAVETDRFGLASRQ